MWGVEHPGQNDSKSEEERVWSKYNNKQPNNSSTKHQAMIRGKNCDLIAMYGKKTIILVNNI